jgi:hypothetical protein
MSSTFARGSPSGALVEGPAVHSAASSLRVKHRCGPSWPLGRPHHVNGADGCHCPHWSSAGTLDSPTRQGCRKHHAIGTRVVIRRAVAPHPRGPRSRPVRDLAEILWTTLWTTYGTGQLGGGWPARRTSAAAPRAQDTDATMASICGGSPGGPPTTPTLPQLSALCYPKLRLAYKV